MLPGGGKIEGDRGGKWSSIKKCTGGDTNEQKIIKRKEVR